MLSNDYNKAIHTAALVRCTRRGVTTPVGTATRLETPLNNPNRPAPGLLKINDSWWCHHCQGNHHHVPQKGYSCTWASCNRGWCKGQGYPNIDAAQMSSRGWNAAESHYWGHPNTATAQRPSSVWNMAAWYHWYCTYFITAQGGSRDWYAAACHHVIHSIPA